jgi:glutathionyl-hydroquinone reductase
VDFERFGESAGWAAKPTKDDAAGSFVRATYTFRGRVVSGGEFEPAPGRYLLYVSYACPWAQRQLIVRELKGLTDAIGLGVVDPVRDGRGWAFREGPDYPNLWDYARFLHRQPAFGSTTKFDHIKRHYFLTHPHINPTRIIPAGFETDWDAPTARQPAADA